MHLAAVTDAEPHTRPARLRPRRDLQPEHVDVEVGDGPGGAVGDRQVDVVRARAHRLRRRISTRSSHSAASTASTGPTRLATGAPAVPTRSTGSFGADWMRRTPGAGPGPAAGSDASPSCGSATALPSAASPAVSATAAAGVASGGSCAPRTVVSRHSTNWVRSFADTSASTPRPNCATFPVTVRSVVTLTLVA